VFVCIISGAASLACMAGSILSRLGGSNVMATEDDDCLGNKTLMRYVLLTLLKKRPKITGARRAGLAAAPARLIDADRTQSAINAPSPL